MLEDIAPRLEGLRVVVPVHGALVQGELAVDVLFVDHIAVAVQLVDVVLRAEGDEDRQRAEIVDMVVDRLDPQRAQIRDDHGAVEGACLRQALGNPAEVVHHPQDPDGKAQDNARQAAECLSHILGIVVLIAGLDLVDLLVQLPVDIEDRVCRVEVYLDRGLGGVNGEGALDGHNDNNVVCRVDPPPDNKAVEPRQHGDQPDIGRDHKVQDADALVALHTQPPQPPVDVAYLHALFIEIGRVVAGGHDIGDKS